MRVSDERIEKVLQQHSMGYSIGLYGEEAANLLADLRDEREELAERDKRIEKLEAREARWREMADALRANDVLYGWSDWAGVFRCNDCGTLHGEKHEEHCAVGQLEAMLEEPSDGE